MPDLVHDQALVELKACHVLSVPEAGLVPLFNVARI